jgi:hypothetical protein
MQYTTLQFRSELCVSASAFSVRLDRRAGMGGVGGRPRRDAYGFRRSERSPHHDARKNIPRRTLNSTGKRLPGCRASLVPVRSGVRLGAASTSSAKFKVDERAPNLLVRMKDTLRASRTLLAKTLRCSWPRP